MIETLLENGTYDQTVKHLERKMELNGLEANEPLVKTQIPVTKKEQNTEKPNKNKMTTPKNDLQKEYLIKQFKLIIAIIAKMPVT